MKSRSLNAAAINNTIDRMISSMLKPLAVEYEAARLQLGTDVARSAALAATDYTIALVYGPLYGHPTLLLEHAVKLIDEGWATDRGEALAVTAEARRELDELMNAHDGGGDETVPEGEIIN